VVRMNKTELLKKYFASSIKTFSTWILITFNIFVLYDVMKNDMGIMHALFFYLLQMCLYLFSFGIIVFALNQLTTKGKTYSGKWTKSGAAILAIGVFIFYGAAITMLFYGFLAILNSQGLHLRINLDAYLIAGTLILLFFAVLNFIVNFSKERDRIGKTEMAKVFFEPAGNLLPIYLCVVFIGLLGPLVILIKILADIISNSPRNTESPFVFELLGGDKLLQEIIYKRKRNKR